jgi:hypothetical protein
MAWLRLGKRIVVLVRRIDEILAQTDPFDLSQAVERYVRTLDGLRIRALLDEARDRMNDYYRGELLHLTDAQLSDSQLQSSFVLFLKSNLRAIGLFGTAFSAGVLNECPKRSVVAIGEEPRGNGARNAVIAAAALALIIIGAAGEHALSNARATAQTPESPPVPFPQAAVPVPPTEAPRRTPRIVAADPKRTVSPAVATAAPAAVAPAPVRETIVVQPRPQPRSAQDPPEHGSSEMTVMVVQHTATPEPTPLDVDDMPEAYSDSTPLPQQSAGQANPDTSPNVTIATPQPTSKPAHGWFKHLDPLRPGAHIRFP